MTGCSALVSGNLTFPALGLGGVATSSIFIPNSSIYLGATFYQQAFLVDPPANPFGATLSNAGEAHIRAR
jgi:hypothetical protein